MRVTPKEARLMGFEQMGGSPQAVMPPVLKTWHIEAVKLMVVIQIPTSRLMEG